MEKEEERLTKIGEGGAGESASWVAARVVWILAGALVMVVGGGRGLEKNWVAQVVYRAKGGGGGG